MSSVPIISQIHLHLIFIKTGTVHLHWWGTLILPIWFYTQSSSNLPDATHDHQTLHMVIKLVLRWRQVHLRGLMGFPHLIFRPCTLTHLHIATCSLCQCVFVVYRCQWSHYFANTKHAKWQHTGMVKPDKLMSSVFVVLYLKMVRKKIPTLTLEFWKQLFKFEGVNTTMTNQQVTWNICREKWQSNYKTQLHHY